MDHETRPFEIYIATPINISNENNDGFDDITNGQEQWGEDGTTTQLMNITTTLQEFETLEVDENDQ